MVVSNKAVRFALTVVLVLSLLAGCAAGNNAGQNAPSGNSGASGNNSSSSSSGSNASEGSGSGEQTAAEQPVELSIWLNSPEARYPSGVQDDPVTKAIAEKTGVIMNVIPWDSVGDPDAKVGAMLASGDLPDIIAVRLADMQKKFITANACLPLDSYVDEYGQNITNLEIRYDYSVQEWSKDVDGNNDGQFYFVGMGGERNSDPLQVRYAPYVRWDLYAQLGYPEINSLHDYLGVLQDMMELEPTNANGQKTYALGARFGDGGSHWIMNDFVGMYGVAIDYWFTYQHDLETFDVTPAITNPDSPIWEVLSFWNQANRMGLIDPDSFIQKREQYLEKLNANRYLFGIGPNPEGDKLFIEQGTPNKGYYQMPSPTGTENYYASYSDPYGNYQYCVSKNTKHPEKAVQLLDFLTSYEGTELIYNGVEGVHWDMVNGKPTIKPDVVDMFLSDPEFALKTGIRKYVALAGRGQNMVNPSHGTSVNFFFHPDVLERRMNDVQKAGAEHFGVQYPAATIIDVKKVTDYDNRPHIGAPFPDELAADQQKAGQYLLPELIKAITAPNDNEFAAQKQRMIDYYNNQLNNKKHLEWLQANKTTLPPLDM